MRILITGASGMLGKDIVKVFQYISGNEVTAVFRSSKDNVHFKGIRIINIDITQSIEFAKVLREVMPDIIIHSAAIINVDQCESIKDDALKLHSTIVSTIAMYSSYSKFVYVSSDSVFEGSKGDYKETDTPSPINYYAQSKFEGEKNTLTLLSNSIVVRTNIYGFHFNGKNSLAEWALKNLKSGTSIEGFTDVYFNPVYTFQLAEILKELIDKDYKGLIHVGSGEYISKYHFLINLAKAFGYNQELIIPKSVDMVNFNAKRPLNTTLNTELLKQNLNFVPELDGGIHKFHFDFNNYYKKDDETNKN